MSSEQRFRLRTARAYVEPVADDDYIIFANEADPIDSWTYAHSLLPDGHPLSPYRA